MSEVGVCFVVRNESVIGQLGYFVSFVFVVRGGI